MGKLLTADICRTLLGNMRKCEESAPLSIREGYFRQALEKSLAAFEQEAAELKSDSAVQIPIKK